MAVVARNQSPAELPETLESESCISPSSFGALPDDAKDDRPAFQAFLDRQPFDRCLSICLQAGRYLISKTGGTSHRRLSGLSLERSCLTLKGQGQSTVLMGTGDGGGPTATFSIVAIKGPGANSENVQPIRGVTISDMRLSGDDTYNTGEQTHVLEVGHQTGAGRGVEQVELRHLWFDLPIKPRMTQDGGPPNEKRGDCIRIIGSPSAPTRFVRLTNSTFTACDRSAIGIQRHTYDVQIVVNTFVASGDQHIDQEPTGNGPIVRHLYSGNLFLDGYPGTLAVTLTGNSEEDPADQVLFVNNTIVGRGLLLNNVRRSVISGNMITGDLVPEYGNQGLIHAIKRSDRLIISNNILRRGSKSPPGPVIKAIHHGTGLPGPVMLSNNFIEQETQFAAIEFESVQAPHVTGNNMIYKGTGTAPAISLRGTKTSVGNVTVVQNRFSGPFSFAVRISPASRQVGPLLIQGNLGDVRVGLRCEAGDYVSKPVVTNNLFTGADMQGCPGQVPGE